MDLSKIKEANKRILHLDNKYNIENHGIIFVYTPPKVGSTTLVSSLRLCLLKHYSIIHIHDELMLKILTGIENVSIIDIINYNALLGKKVYVIDIYRRPIERKLSEYFHNISTYNFNDNDENIKKYSVDQLIHRFNQIYPHLDTADYYFEKFGVVPPERFDFDKKYIHQYVKNIHFIKLRFNDISIWDKILSDIFKTEIIIIREESEKNAIYELYNKVKEEYKLPSNYYDDLNNDKSLKYYENEMERHEYMNKWYKNSLSNIVNALSKNDYINQVLKTSKITIKEFPYIDSGCKCLTCDKKRLDVLKEYKLSGKIGKVFHEKKEIKMVKKVKEIKKREVKIGLLIGLK